MSVGPPSPESGIRLEAAGVKLLLSSCAVGNDAIAFEPSAATKSVLPSSENATPRGSATLRSFTPAGEGTTS